MSWKRRGTLLETKFKVGDTVAAPVCTTNPEKKIARVRYGYDLAKVIATGRNKRVENLH